MSFPEVFKGLTETFSFKSDEGETLEARISRATGQSSGSPHLERERKDPKREPVRDCWKQAWKRSLFVFGKRVCMVLAEHADRFIVFVLAL